MSRNQYKPDRVSPPGETLKDLLAELGMTQDELASGMNVPKETISEIIAGNRAITADTALRLERVLGVPAAFWNAREGHYRKTTTISN